MLDLINSFISHIPSDAVLAGVAIFVEAIARQVPSEKPLSILYVTEDVLHGLGNLAKSTGDALDKILPQRVAKPAAPSA